METKQAKRVNKRAIVSLGLLITLLAMPVSALTAHAAHGNPPVRHAWMHIHLVTGILFMVFGILHVIYNWKALKRYMPGSSRTDR